MEVDIESQRLDQLFRQSGLELGQEISVESGLEDMLRQ